MSGRDFNLATRPVHTSCLFKLLICATVTVVSLFVRHFYNSHFLGFESVVAPIIVIGW